LSAAASRKVREMPASVRAVRSVSSLSAGSSTASTRCTASSSVSTASRMRTAMAARCAASASAATGAARASPALVSAITAPRIACSSSIGRLATLRFGRPQSRMRFSIVRRETFISAAMSRTGVSVRV